jgi:type III secretion protein J
VILHDLDEVQANRVWVALRQFHFHPQKQRAGAGWSIAVSSRESALALTALEKLRLPRRARVNGEERSTSIVPSRSEREAARERALAQRLEETLMVLPGVAEARVHIVLELEESRSDKLPQSSASVLLVLLPGTTVDPNQIREIVSGGGALKRESVTVAISSLPAFTIADLKVEEESS